MSFCFKFCYLKTLEKPKYLLGEIFATQAVSLKFWQPLKPFVPGIQYRSPKFKSDQSTFCLGDYWSSREEKGRFSETNSLTRSSPCKASFVSLIFASTSQDVIPKNLELQKLPQSTLHICLNNVIETLEVNMSKHLKHHIWLLCS